MLDINTEPRDIKFKTVDTPGDRVDYIRVYRKMLKSEFAKSIGITPQGYHGMTLHGYCTRLVAIVIEYKHGFNAEWILTGEGEMLCDVREIIKGEVIEEMMEDLAHYLRIKGSVDILPLRTIPE